MQYPLISEYIEAIRSAEDNFDQYSALRPVLDDKGNPVMSSGNFAVVFKMRDEQTKRLYAVKCFTRDQEGRQANYRKIAEELEFVSSPYLVHFRFLEKELFVDSSQGDAEEYPVLVMDWVEGEPLDRYLWAHLQDTYALQLLAYRFCRMGAWLLSQPFAHGDLKPDNILVKADGSLVLVDYDGMFVPAMQGEQAGELGSPDFRHPLRTAADFNEHIDDFSIATIALSLKAIALRPSLYDQFAASDRLLFAASNYMDLGKSALLPTLCSLTSDAELAVLLSIFLLAHAKNSLGMISFRLFLLQEPEKPKEEVLRTDVTDEDREQAIADEYGVLYSPDGLRLIKANYNIETYEIKDGTKVICDKAFSLCKSLTSIQLPESLTSIGDRAFFRCESFKSIHLPESVNSIGNSAFSMCYSLTSIHLPESVNSIGNSAFSCCKSLTSIHLPESVKSIGNSAFRGCESLTSIHLPESVNSIGDSAFSCCTSLTSIHLPESVKSIGDWAFWDCRSLTSIHLPESVKSIGNEAFVGCTSLNSIHLPESLTSIGNEAFRGCKSLTSIHLPESVKSIGDNPFSMCKLLSITCDSSYFWVVDGFLISKEGKLIASLSDKTHITIPKSVNSIGNYAFWHCTSLTSIHLPESLTSIGNEAFCHCRSLTSIHLPESLTSIGIEAFSNCYFLTSIHLPESLTSIGNEAFWDCESLTSIHLPESLTSIGYKAFSGCTSLKSIHLSESLTSIGNEAFLRCTSLTSIHLPESVKSIGNNPFSRCKLLSITCDSPYFWVVDGFLISKEGKLIASLSDKTHITIPKSVNSIGNYAFWHCTSLTSIHLPESLTSIGNEAFCHCRSLTSIHLPDSLTTIGWNAFGNCESLTTIYIPKGSKEKFKRLLGDKKLIEKLVEE